MAGTRGPRSWQYRLRVSADGLHAEQRARVLIDSQLTAAGWHVCDVNKLDLINHPLSMWLSPKLRGSAL